MKNFLEKITLFLVAQVGLLISCSAGQPPVTAGYIGGASSLSSISINLPGKENLPSSQQQLLNGYHFSITPVVPQISTCTAPTQVNISQAWTSALLSQSLVQGCDYQIVLELGSLSADQKSLTSTYYANNTSTPGGTLLRATDFGTASQYAMNLTVNLTQAGVSAGFGQAITPISGPTVQTPVATVTPVSNPSPTVTPTLREIPITVSGEGYTPSAISIKAGESVKLLVTRLAGATCGGEIVFPDLGIRKTLTVGQVVPIILPAQKTGQLNFACGMGMYKGQIVVQ